MCFVWATLGEVRVGWRVEVYGEVCGCLEWFMCGSLGRCGESGEVWGVWGCVCVGVCEVCVCVRIEAIAVVL